MRYPATAARIISLLTLSGVARRSPSHLASAFAPGISFAASYEYSTSSTSLFSIVDEVTAEMKTAMKAKDTTTLGSIRLMRSAFANAQIEEKTDALTDEQAINCLRKMAKMRQESIGMFKDGGAEDRAAAEQAELDVIGRWLPQLADEETTRSWVVEAIEGTGVAGDMSKMGMVMGALMKNHKAELDGKLAQKIVKEELSK
uniref:Asn/Gln amidotransferase domain-containing protein n=1 Tax=Minutocellus polymorphus TaxID=265543 RepID=A0A6U0JY75_9STRA|mmetsp:Transcript_19001/g.31502  ORF Transcript_19001/g.31502 Transcript_19001/m.31502 type:complete len:201 (+) Transcript_19001:58-660(+)